MELETRKECVRAMRICRFCLTQNEPLTSLYEKSKAPKNYVTLAMKIMASVAIEVFPSDKMPQYICNRCKLFMELSYGFKQVCRQADQSVLHFVQDGTLIEPITWPPLLNKVFKAHSKAEFGLVRTVTQGGATVKVMAEEISDIEEGDDDNVYDVKIGDGSEEGKSIKVITSVNKPANTRESRKGRDVDSEDMEDDPPMLVKEGCFPCDECDCTYPLEQLLTLHKMQKHRPRRVECDQCDAKFFSRYDLMTHQVRHSTEMPFQCVACDKKFKRLILLKRHEKMVHCDLPQLKCMKCPATFLSKIELDAHKMRHDGQHNQSFKCSICNKSFSENRCLHKHIEKMHSMKPGFACNYCPAHFTNMSKLGKHLRTHAGERAYPCKHCDKSFIKSHHYTRHLRMKHSEQTLSPRSSHVKSDVWRCEECEQSFTTQDELLYHSALHATASLTCPLCQEKFQDVEAVTAHIKSHVNGAEYMCDYCELIFTTQQKLDTHMANTHDIEYNDKDTENDEDDSMDAELEDGEESINVKEVDGHMVVEIKKAGDFMLPDTAQMEEEEKQDQSEDSEMDVSYSDAASVPVPMKSATLVNKKDVVIPKSMPVASSQLDLRATSAVLTPTPTKPFEVMEVETVSIVKKAEDIKKKAIHRQSSPVSTNAKEKTTVKVESSSAAGASDLSLRLLEKELQDLQRTSRNDVQKTKRHLQTSTPKSVRFGEKKEPATPKSAPEKVAIEKKLIGRPPKENREAKNISTQQNTAEQKKEEKEKSAVKDEKETKDVKEKDTPKVVKNGTNDKPASEETVRRSNRPSKVKDYAKMIRDSGDESEQEASEEEPDAEEETKEEDKSMETPRRGRKPLPKPTPQKQAASTTAAIPDSAPKKRGRPRKGIGAVPAKMVKKEDFCDGEPELETEKVDNTKSVEAAPKPASAAEQTTPESTPKEQSSDPDSNVIMSPSGQTLKQVPIKALPPGIKPLPLPRKMTSGEVCEMQIGKKVVKVQKIVMTKAEADAMIKQGLVEMKDGTIVLKPGIKLPGAGSLKSQLMGDTSEIKKESPKKSMPTRCDFGE